MKDEKLIMLAKQLKFKVDEYIVFGYYKKQLVVIALQEKNKYFLSFPLKENTKDLRKSIIKSPNIKTIKIRTHIIFEEQCINIEDLKYDRILPVLEIMQKELSHYQEFEEKVCEECSTPVDDLLCVNGLPMFVCDSCLTTFKNNVMAVNNVIKSSEPQYIKGILYSFWVPVVGAILWCLGNVYLNRIVLVIPVFTAFCSIYFYLKGAGKIHLLGRITVFFFPFIAVYLGQIFNLIYYVYEDMGVIRLYETIYAYNEVFQKNMFSEIINYIFAGVGSFMFILRAPESELDWQVIEGTRNYDIPLKI